MRLVVGIWLGLGMLGQSQTGEDRFFQDQVAPVLEKRCVHCHGASAPKGNFALTTARAILKGGDSGPAVVPGKPEESPLLELVTGNPPEMPQKDAPLSKQE